MSTANGIEVKREDIPAWEAAVASFQRSLRGQLQLIRIAADARSERQCGDSGSGLAATGS